LDSEIQIFQNALDFSEVKTREAMVPRAEVIAVEESNTQLEEIKALFISTGFLKSLFTKKILIKFWDMFML